MYLSKPIRGLKQRSLICKDIVYVIDTVRVFLPKCPPLCSNVQTYLSIGVHEIYYKKFFDKNHCHQTSASVLLHTV